MLSFDKSDFTRIYSALMVPFHADESVNYEALRQLVEREVQEGVEGFYVCGSSGEGLLMSVEEREKVTECVLDQVAGRAPVIAHCGTIRTADVIRLARHAIKAGCVAVSMIPPYYYHFSMDDITHYYLDVIDAVPDAPVIIYNIPSFTGIEFSKDNASELLANPNIIGIKHTSKDLYNLERMATDYPEKVLINGYDEQFLAALCMGAQATIGTTVNLFYPLFKGVRAAFDARDLDTGKILQQDINWRMENIVKVGLFPATKYGCALKGTDCGTCRRPFRDITQEQKALIRKTVETPYPEELKKYV
ncbi:MAG: N-acetylneuraminate lyase [Lachnospiraceae bacterium]|jgi:N-acetylneuraminate lyase